MPKKNEDKRARTFGLLVLVVILGTAGAMAAMKYAESRPNVDTAQVEQLARCLTENGARMYGAVWCGHCKEQKKAFGSAFGHIDYVECAVPGNPQAQTPECEQAGIKSYPTWIFGDGSQASGLLSFETLAERSGCPYSPSGSQATPGIILNEGVTGTAELDGSATDSVMLDLPEITMPAPTGLDDAASE